MHPSIEIEPDDFAGYHAVILDAAGETVLYVTDSYLTRQDAEHAARAWLTWNRWPVSA